MQESRLSQFQSLIRLILVSWSLLTPRERRYFTFRFFLRGILNLVDIVAIGLMGVLGALTATGLSGTSLEFYGYELPSPTIQNVTFLVALIAILFVAKGAVAIAFDWWNSVFIAQIEIRNAARVARFFFGGTLSRLRGKSRADIGFILGTGVSAAFSGVMGSATSLLLEGLVFVSVFAVFLAVDWVSAVFILAYFIVVVTLIQLTSAKRYLRAGKNIQKASVDAGASVLEMVDSFREIAVLSKQEFFLSRYLEARKLDARTAVGLQVLKSVPRYLTESGLIVGAFFFVLWQLNRGSLGEGLFALGVFLAGAFRMMGAILPLQQIWNDLKLRQIFVDSVHEILVPFVEEEEVLDSGLFTNTKQQNFRFSEPCDNRGLSIEVRNLKFTHHGRSEAAVNEISLDIKPGQFVAIVGPSGAGKTTFVDLLLGLYEPLAGKITVEGLPPEDLRATYPGLISYVPQKPGLVAGSIAQNVALGEYPEEVDEDAVLAALEKAQLATLVDSLPDGIHSSLGAHSDALSGGQIQRLGLARALYTNPRLIVLDEATSALDAATEASIAEAIRGLGAETTVIVIAHRLSTIQHADVVYVMDEGKILASGTFKEVRKKVPMIEEYVKLMSFDDD